MQVSKELLMILNLKNTALDHKEHCKHNCNVSIFELKQTAKYIRDQLKDESLIKGADEMIKEMPNI